MSLTGNKLAGGNPDRGRVDNDFYATDPKAVQMLLDEITNRGYKPKGHNLLEPCVGQGHILDTVNRYFNDYFTPTALDIVDRGYPNTIITDFLTWKSNKLYDLIITNPPYSLAGEFIEKGMECLSIGGHMAMFLKLQFLEGQKRKDLFDKYPPKYVYVFRNRIGPWRDGLDKNPDTGKRWASTITFAWFIWEKGNRSEPIIRWL